jgi:hypothetical protein
MFLPRAQSFAATAVFAMAGAVVFSGNAQGDAQPQAGASAQQTQPASTRPATATDQGGRQAPVFGAPASALTPTLAPGMGGTSPGGLVFPVEQVTGFDTGQPPAGGIAPSPDTPRNRVLPSGAGNAMHVLPGAAAYSPNWLVDGVARIEADERRQRLGTARDGRIGGGIAIDPLTGKPGLGGNRDVRPNVRGAGADIDANADAGDKSAAARKAVAAANDPLVQYLQKWMETSTGAAAAVIASQSSDSGDAQHYATQADVAVADSATTGGVPADAPRTAAGAYIAPQMTQPMLEATGPSIVRLPPPVSPQSDAAWQTAPAAESPEQTMTGVPENMISTPKPVEQNPEPTKPLVNDKKYFPQLRRF